MSDNEEESSDEESAEEMGGGAEEEEEKPDMTKFRRPSAKVPLEEPPAEMTEAEKAMLAAKKRHEEEEAAKLVDYEERRRQEREQAEEELRVLKERQQQRRLQREQEEREFAEHMREEERRRRQDEDERRAAQEVKKRKREEEKLRRQQMIDGSLCGAVEAPPPPNFAIKRRDPNEPRDENQTAMSSAEVARKQLENREGAKRVFLENISRKRDVANMTSVDLKAEIRLLHEKITRAEAEKYDLEKRHDRQEYDLKELNELQLHVARNKALKKGLNPDEAVSSVHPPKLNVASKFDRQTDRRSYGDRRDLFEKPVVPKKLSLVRGSGRPPPQWGRRENEELESIRRNTEGPRYVEAVKAEGEAARPPMEPIPLVIPEDDIDVNQQESPADVEENEVPVDQS